MPIEDAEYGHPSVHSAAALRQQGSRSLRLATVSHTLRGAVECRQHGEVRMSDTRDKPYRVTLHWDASREGTWTGQGRDLNPACGQSEFITVTDMEDAVDCQKCRNAMGRHTA